MATVTINKKNLIWIGVIALAFIAVFFTGWWLRPPKIITQQQAVDDLRNSHQQDSLKYAFDLSKLREDSADFVLIIEEKDEKIAVLQKMRYERSDEISVLPATETIELFNQNTGDTAKILVINRDTSCIAPIPSIRIANVLMEERKTYIAETIILKEKCRTYADLLNNQDEKLSLTYKRIRQLTDDYYNSHLIIDNQQKSMIKLGKKIRTRNIVIGISWGVAIGGIFTAILIK